MLTQRRTSLLLFFSLFCDTFITFSNANLGGLCSNDYQCRTAFSFCGFQKRCTCSEGFENVDSKCRPTAYNCPYGKPAMQNNKTDPIFCKIGANQTNSCSEGYYCHAHEFAYDDVKFETKVGHCCLVTPTDTVPKARCPVGHTTTAKCGFASHEVTCESNDTMHCVQPVASGLDIWICCSKPCPYFPTEKTRSQRVVDGLCYD